MCAIFQPHQLKGLKSYIEIQYKSYSHTTEQICLIGRALIPTLTLYTSKKGMIRRKGILMDLAVAS